MKPSYYIEGIVETTDGRNASVKADDGTLFDAIVPQSWFSAKGQFDLCNHLPLGVRVRVLLRDPPDKNRVVDLIK